MQPFFLLDQDRGRARNIETRRVVLEINLSWMGLEAAVTVAAHQIAEPEAKLASFTV